ncbi:MAG: HDIG domain-containing protein [Candidatus Methanomethyliaceae archaeon]|nr:HDIG domain-containing protein [Candidatus Methanomethyliaceae archaeon]
MPKEEALKLIRDYVLKENNIKHMVAVSGIMRELAARLGENVAEWELVGLLHDIDFERCNGIEDHTFVAKEILRGKISDHLIEVIMAHNFENTKVPPDSAIKKALVASDALSGLIVATALVMPSKKIAEIKRETLIKKFKSKDFARGASRERILLCSELGLSLEEFMDIGLEGMKKVAAELGL